MNFLHTKFLFAALGLTAVPVLVASACSGSEFSAADADAGNAGGSGGGAGATSGGSQGKSGSGGSSTGVTCQGPEDCDDGDPCTVDSCGALGRCQAAPKCEEPLQCCDGECGECCADEDCADDLECTNDVCFAGSCTHVPNDAACTETQYCSAVAGCKDKEPCTGEVAGECEDGDPCTSDACVNSFCEHSPCSEGLLCCPGVGCGSCCAHSQCGDGDPCTSDVCSQGECENPGLCSGSGAGECCVGPDGTSASCGACCSAAECDDQVDCTIDVCEQGSCTNTPGQCGVGMVCDPVRGCVAAAECGKDADCDDLISCTQDACVEGSCVNTPNNALCESGTCSIPHRGCIQCTGDFQCNDGNECTSDTCDLSTYTCKHTPGACGSLLCCGTRCAECCISSDCGGVLGNDGGAEGGSIPGPVDGGIIGLCSWWACDSGKCLQKAEYCDFGTCCPGYGCNLGGSPCPIDG